MVRELSVRNSSVSAVRLSNTPAGSEVSVVAAQIQIRQRGQVVEHPGGQRGQRRCCSESAPSARPARRNPPPRWRIYAFAVQLQRAGDGGEVGVSDKGAGDLEKVVADGGEEHLSYAPRPCARRCRRSAPGPEGAGQGARRRPRGARPPGRAPRWTVRANAPAAPVRLSSERHHFCRHQHPCRTVRVVAFPPARNIASANSRADGFSGRSLGLGFLSGMVLIWQEPPELQCRQYRH